jgi:hypothetical protein
MFDFPNQPYVNINSFVKVGSKPVTRLNATRFNIPFPGVELHTDYRYLGQFAIAV